MSGGSYTDFMIDRDGAFWETPPASAGYAAYATAAINDDGIVVGYAIRDDGRQHVPLYWHGQELYDVHALLDTPGWKINGLLDISDSGYVLGYGRLNGGSQHYLLLRPVPEPTVTLALLTLTPLLRRRRREQRSA